MKPTQFTDLKLMKIVHSKISVIMLINYRTMRSNAGTEQCLTVTEQCGFQSGRSEEVRRMFPRKGNAVHVVCSWRILGKKQATSFFYTR